VASPGKWAEREPGNLRLHRRNTSFTFDGKV
jgi:hypothetical protein